MYAFDEWQFCHQVKMLCRRPKTSYGNGSWFTFALETCLIHRIAIFCRRTFESLLLYSRSPLCELNIIILLVKLKTGASEMCQVIFTASRIHLANSILRMTVTYAGPHKNPSVSEFCDTWSNYEPMKHGTHTHTTQHGTDTHRHHLDVLEYRRF